MTQPPPHPLQRAADALVRVLPTKDHARRWYQAYIARLGPRAVVDTVNGGKAGWVHRREAGSELVLPGATAHWGVAQTGERLHEGPQIADGRQSIKLMYGEDGEVVERSLGTLFPGRLVELARVIANARDGFEASLAFVAGLDDERHGPGRMHYPVAAPGTPLYVWRTGLIGCRRALHDGRVGPDARFVVSDGLAGTAVGSGTTQEEALAAYHAAVARRFPRLDVEMHTAWDDYDDDGNLLRRGEIPPEFGGPAASSEATSHVLPLGPEEGEEWKAGGAGERPPSFLPPGDDPEGVRIDLGTFTLRGPKPDASPLPPRPECLPHVIVPLDPPNTSPAPGRWVRLLGEIGVTRHALRIDTPSGFLLVGEELLALMDLADVQAALAHLEDRNEEFESVLGPERQRFYRFRGSYYRWRTANAHRPEGLGFSHGGAGPRFEPGSLDGDQLQAMVYRHQRIPRPPD